MHNILFGLFAIIANNGDGTYTLSSSEAEVVINVSRDSETFGEILNFLCYLDSDTIDLIGENGELLKIEYGDYRPAIGNAKISSDTLILTSANFQNFKREKAALETVIKVSLNGRVLNLEYLFIPHETIDIPSELHLLYRTYLWDSLYSYCQSGISEKVRLSFPDIPRHIIVTSLDPIVEFKDNHTNFYFITRNPSYAQSQCWAYPSGRKDFFIKILYSGGPLYKVGCEPYGPPLHSILVAGDTIHREFILSLSSKNYLELAEDSLFTSPLIQML